MPASTTAYAPGRTPAGMYFDTLVFRLRELDATVGALAEALGCEVPDEMVAPTDGLPRMPLRERLALRLGAIGFLMDQGVKRRRAAQQDPAEVLRAFRGDVRRTLMCAHFASSIRTMDPPMPVQVVFQLDQLVGSAISALIDTANGVDAVAHARKVAESPAHAAFRQQWRRFLGAGGVLFDALERAEVVVVPASPMMTEAMVEIYHRGAAASRAAAVPGRASASIEGSPRRPSQVG